jgi:arylsulfatase A-like enzyme
MSLQAARGMKRAGGASAMLLLLLLLANDASAQKPAIRPNIVVVIADQWRQEAFGFAGNPDVKTPALDSFAGESVRFVNAVATIPVCTPSRAALLTGRYGTSTGMFMNDVPLRPDLPTLPSVLASAGYRTAFIGKWHVDGHGRSAFIPEERRHGFAYFKALECTHDYNRSYYYDGSDTARRQWPGYDAEAQTEDAISYIRVHGTQGDPFFMMLSLGPPHEPYQTAPDRYRRLYSPDQIHLRPNVPPDKDTTARTDLAGYYAHCTAVDACFGRLMDSLRSAGLSDNTIVLFTSDHGDMIGSHASAKKQQPWEESCRVPMLLRWPRWLTPAENTGAIATEDIMPTLLSLAACKVPDGVQGHSYANCLLHNGSDPAHGAALVMCPAPFGQWSRAVGGREYRAIRTARYTYARDLNGPWLLFDNVADPFQMHNLVNDNAIASTQNALDKELRKRLKARGDRFLPADALIKRWGYRVDKTGTVPYDP